ncbi:Cytochrome c oxidase subunit [Halocaridina rubra]|uniref:Cytochrome c oxidase subunit n=1 Tax=Halocaridina rubra TaxID=373956 RepID=A0AAN8X8X3_HALRR
MVKGGSPPEVSLSAILQLFGAGYTQSHLTVNLCHYIMSLPKPVMRGLLTAQIKKHIAIASVLCFITVGGFKVLVQDPRKRLYADFYKNYDALAEFNRIRNLGYLQSARPDGEE